MVFLFGAGASHLDSGKDRPPLLKGLVEPLQRAFPRSWGQIPDSSANAFTNNFEKAMDEYSYGSEHLVELLKDAAQFFSGFRPRTGELEPYYRVVAEYRDRLLSGDILASTLNYDCLIELSAKQLGVEVNYFGRRYGMGLLKLHGSCNFTVHPAGITVGGKVTISREGRADFPVDDPPPEASEVPRVLQECKFPPAMALMTPGKEVVCGHSEIQRIQEGFEEAVRMARILIVVGANFNPLDQHVWMPVYYSSAHLGFVGNRTSCMSLEHERKLGRTHWIGGRFEESVDDIFDFIRERES